MPQRLRRSKRLITLSATLWLCKTFANNAPVLFRPNMSPAIPASPARPGDFESEGKASAASPEALLVSGGMSWEVLLYLGSLRQSGIERTKPIAIHATILRRRDHRRSKTSGQPEPCGPAEILSSCSSRSNASRVVSLSGTRQPPAGSQAGPPRVGDNSLLLQFPSH